MATLIGDVFQDSSPFGIGGTRQFAHTPDAHLPYNHPRRPSRRRDELRRSPSIHSAQHTMSQPGQQDWEARGAPSVDEKSGQTHATGATRLPSPPSSAASASASTTPTQTDDMAPDPSFKNAQVASASGSASTDSAKPRHPTTTFPNPTSSIPSPDSEGASPWSATAKAAEESSDPARPMFSAPQQTTIRIRNLAHIQSLARADLMTGQGPGGLNDPTLQEMKYEISDMPIGDIIEMVAALLTKITTSNDAENKAHNRNAVHMKQIQASKNEEGSGESSMSPLASSVLAFHGKNVPAITILSYLSRIHKYCPTTYEVFLSLLVYFDRMSERVNQLVISSQAARNAPAHPSADTDAVMKDESEDSDETDSDLADDDDDEDDGSRDTVIVNAPSSTSASNQPASSATTTAAGPSPDATFFVVDSYNIHRLIIAGVTCASKFFSDVFYTNSRYAKVGGLPLAELNHLELQFLLLNDFRLAVPVEDLEAYATMLVEFYVREVVSSRARPGQGPSAAAAASAAD